MYGEDQKKIMVDSDNKLIHQFLDNIKSEGKSRNSIRSLRTDLSQFPAYMAVKGKESFGDISLQEVKEFVIRDKAGDAAISRRVWTLKKFYAFLHEEGYTKEDISKGLRVSEIAGAQAKTYDALSLEDMGKLLKYGEEKLSVENTPLPYLLLSCLLSGLKPNDISALTFEQVRLDDKRGVFQIGSRKIPLSKHVSLDLFKRAFALVQLLAEKTVFDFSVGQVWFWLQKYSKATGLSVNTTQFRWRFFFDLVQEGKRAEEVAEMSGLTNAYVNKFYPDVLKIVGEK